MPHYRLYFLQVTGGINEAVDLDCATDTEAIDRARDLSKGREVELWQGIRLVKRIMPE
jgi:hypothetical protein